MPRTGDPCGSRAHVQTDTRCSHLCRFHEHDINDSHECNAGCKLLEEAMMQALVRTPSGSIRARRPLRATLAGLLLFAVTAAAANNTPPVNSDDLKRPPPPADLEITATDADQCTVDIKWTQSNLDNTYLTGFQYRTRTGPEAAWGSWMDIPGGASIRSATVSATGGNSLQLRVTVSQEAHGHSHPSSVVVASSLDPDDPNCQQPPVVVGT